MQPLMWSMNLFKNENIAWRRTGYNIAHYKNHFLKSLDVKKLIGANESSNYGCLSFSIKFPSPNDVVYLAYHYPFSYTRLQVRLSSFAYPV